jgi:hypothetical protein
VSGDRFPKRIPRRYWLAPDAVVCTAMEGSDEAPRPDYTEVQVVPLDAIVIRREDVPVASLTADGYVTAGEEENGDPYIVQAHANPNWAWHFGLNVLAVSEFLREHPPVDEAQVSALTAVFYRLPDAPAPDDAAAMARELVARGVRVVTP